MEYREYVKKPITVRAKQLTESEIIETPEGRMRGWPGDWLVIGIKGERYIVDREIFGLTYDEVGTQGETNCQREEL